MRIVTLAARAGWHTDEIERAARARGHEHQLATYEDLTEQFGRRRRIGSAAVSLEEADLVLARIIPSGSLEQLIYRVDALHQLSERGVRVVNRARAIERSVDKSWTTGLLEGVGLRVPDTIVADRLDGAIAAFRELGGDVIVKPLFGSMGLGMLRLTDEDLAWRVFRTIERIQGVYYVQRTIPHDGSDIRAFVIGDRVAAAIERSAPGWRTNVSRGGSARAITLSPEHEAMALAAARAIEADYAGVDLLASREGETYVLEVNGIPGWEGLQRATGLDVAGMLLDTLAGSATVTEPQASTA